MMKSVLFGTFVIVLTLGLLAACGKSQSESERSFTDACVKMRGGNEVYRQRCECEAGVIASKLTAGELKAYVATQDIMGKPLTKESAAAHGFTFEEFSTLGKKMQQTQGEVSKACAGK
jgi:hypothetical protein